MGNLEKAGVLVVVALLAMILVITVLNPPADVPQSRPEAPQLSGTAPRVEPPVTPPNPVPSPLNGAGGAGLTPVNENPNDQSPESRPGVIRPGPMLTPVPTPTPTPSPLTSESELELVKVKLAKDDSLYKIASKRYGARRAAEGVKAILAVNPGLNPAKLKLGSEIEIPKALPPAMKSERAVSTDGAVDERIMLESVQPKASPRAPATKKAATPPKRQPLPFEGG